MSFQKTTALCGLLCALPFLAATPALADCSFDNPTTLTCDGAAVITTEVDEDIDGLQVVVEAGTEIVVGDDAVRLRGDDNMLTNAGDITSTGGGDEAVQADGENFTVINTGLIESELDKGLQADDEDGLNVTNSGSIIAADEAIEGRNGVTILNQTGGLIQSGEDGVQFGAGEVTNEAGATIIGGFGGGDGDAIDIDSGTITNHGLIQSDGAGSAGVDIDAVDVDDNPLVAGVTITNYGSILGDIGVLVEPTDGLPAGTLNETTQTIYNYGILRGLGGTALDLSGGDDVVSLFAGSVTQGDIFLGAGIDQFSLDIDAVFDGPLFVNGGAGNGDIVELVGTISDLDVSAFGAGVLDVAFAGTSFQIAGFEQLSVNGRTFALSDIGIAPVPLPASAFFLLAGLGGLVALRRARA